MIEADSSDSEDEEDEDSFEVRSSHITLCLMVIIKSSNYISLLFNKIDMCLVSIH